MSDTLNLLLIPMDDTVVFPTMDVTLPIDVGDEEQVLLVPRHEGEYAKVGTIAKVSDRVRLPGGAHGATLSGIARGVAGAAHSDAAGRLRVEVTESPDASPVDGRMRELVREYRATVEEILEIRGDDGRIASWVRAIVEPGALADTSGYAPDLSFDQKVRLLELTDVTERLELALEFQRERLAELQVRRRIREDVEEGAGKQQREYVLRKQMESIRRELGEDDASFADDYRTKIDASAMPDHVREQAERELGRLERMGEQGGEAQMVRTYLDWLVAVPWGEQSEERLEPLHTREVLDADHAGLDDVKDRIVEYVAVRKLRAERSVTSRGDDGLPSSERETSERSDSDGLPSSERETSERSDSVDAPTEGEAPRARPQTPQRPRGEGAILTLIGPPGTGKTSIGESIARSMGREFVRMSLGGVRDEAEIRGHRRTYIGALPGRLVRALRDAGTMNPVIMLDEIDKVGADWRGDPSSALLEVLDPAQNSTFRDHYLDLELDLSQVIFIATANQAETIPGPLLDRMEVIRFDGYTVAEKTAIARDYLFPRQREANGLRDGEVVISDQLLQTVVAEYTREAGVRQLERELGTLLRKTATRVASSGAGDPSATDDETPASERQDGVAPQADAPITIDLEFIRDALGRQKVFQEAAARTAIPGVATGLAVTGAGGDVLFVEATAMPGTTAGLTLTGQLGDVMKESARIALTYVRANADELGIPADAFENREFHVHVPAGAIPKDGPSAGVTMVTALASLLSGRPVKHTVGMTGEVTLQGRVLPIGGLKQKVLAAHAAGLTDVVLPERNRGDLDDVPQDVADAMSFHPVMTIGEVLELALEPARKRSKKASA